MKMNSNIDSKRRIQFNIEFQKLKIAYNNVFSFCYKFFIVDRINNVWTTYRCQNSIKHLLEILFVEFDDVKRFVQIHIIDFIQFFLKRRIKSNIDDNILNEIVLFRLQRLFKKMNFYIKNLKTCVERIKKFDQFEIKIHLKQNDFSRREKKTMNKFTFDEIVIVIVMFDDQNDEKSVNKNILIQIQNFILFYIIFYWKSCYMFLRYSLIFFKTNKTETTISLSKNIKDTSIYWFEKTIQMFCFVMNWFLKRLRFFHEKNNFCIKIMMMCASKIKCKNWIMMISISALKKIIQKKIIQKKLYRF